MVLAQRLSLDGKEALFWVRSFSDRTFQSKAKRLGLLNLSAKQSFELGLQFNIFVLNHVFATQLHLIGQHALASVIILGVKGKRQTLGGGNNDESKNIRGCVGCVIHNRAI
jgi:hypothetical protein